jgi:hypothetical protein
MPLLADPLDFPADAEPGFAEGLRTGLQIATAAGCSLANMRVVTAKST